ncbi:MAG: ribonuclease III [bacterium]
MTTQDLITTLNIPVNDISLINNAFVHRSYLNENPKWKESNERLEYLGDAVLELATSAFLYTRFPDYQEGMLTNLRAALVRTTSLAQISKKLALNNLLLMSKGEEAGGGRDNISLLADCFEAFLGAVYLDSGYKSVVDILEKNLFPNIEDVLVNTTYKDKKSELQEVSQAKYHVTPYYELLFESGPDHDKEFVMQVTIGNDKFGVGKGKSKQTAQEAAATTTLEIINHT